MPKKSRARMYSFLMAGAFSSLLMFSFTAPRAYAAEAPYKIASGDVLLITVYGDTGLTGTFPVSVDGTIAYPILGNITVYNHTIAEIGQTITQSLLQHIPGLSASVAVKEYAPVFVIGDVQKPGKYEYRPGMIALELFALSGGLRQASDKLDTAGIQLVAARQEYADTSLQLFAQDVKRARLEAELNEKPFEYDLASGIDTIEDKSDRQQVVDSERKLFDLRLSALESEATALQAQKKNYEEEITTLEQSTQLRNDEISLLEQNVKASQSLVDKGLTAQSTLRDTQRQLSAMRRDALEFGSFLARAKQNENAIEQRLLALRDSRSNDAAKDLRDIDLDIIRLRKKMAFIAQTMGEIGAAAQRVSSRDETVKLAFTVVRVVDGEYRETILSEHDMIRAGDILRAQLELPKQVVAKAEN
ncbi:polysaccharide biosynthesis/export family protein [Phyllobacterium myrsinacearum]|uniref:Polysaccharide export outer membrane protein n=1 Tax=Phyllobacterium myrsinacearum TaxID=28101 RepID=A0A839EKS8_9HYPH|nr:polysaccharide biosynthesis/export family protein [Phyllobacterium myrsinacearum]MBA8878908.1 polysaccharide export outer membrane protein [Phyllobacterium myrsinacearum]